MNLHFFNTKYFSQYKIGKIYLKNVFYKGFYKLCFLFFDSKGKMPRIVNLFLVLLSFNVLLIFSFKILFIGLTFPDLLKSALSKADFLNDLAGEFAEETKPDEPGEIRIWPWPFSAFNTNP